MSNNQQKSPFYGELYRYIYKNRQASRKQIAKALKLSLPTVANNLQQLIDENIIFIDGTFESTGGRKANTYICNANARYAIGLDITRNHINMVLLNLSVEIIDSNRIRIPFEDTKPYYQYISKLIDDLLKSNNIETNKLLGVGVSLPALVCEGQKEIRYLKVLDSDGKIYDHMKEFLHYPFFLYNDADSAGLAEWWYTSNSRTAVYLSLNPSVGGATINGTNIYTGDNNRASEFGHITIVPEGRKCYCGKRGCADAYISETILSDFTEGNLQQFFEELKENVGYKRIFDQYLNYLALTINTLRLCYDCDVIIGGNIGSYIGDYIDAIKEKTQKLNPFDEDVDYIRICQFKSYASAVGAALHFVQLFISEL